MEDRINVLFVQETEKNKYDTESLWCKEKNGNFIVDNIPFIAERISLGDIIQAELDADDNQFYFEDFIDSSGNTTVRLHVYNDQNDKIEEIRKWLQTNGCSTELFLDKNIIAVNVPKDVSYKPIKKYLDDGEEVIWTYEESCLEHEY